MVFEYEMVKKSLWFCYYSSSGNGIFFPEKNTAKPTKKRVDLIKSLESLHLNWITASCH